MIRDLVLQSGGRSMCEIVRFLPDHPFRNAARDVLATPGTVFILTGFYIPEADAMETDGPPGAVALGKALERLRRSVVYIADAKIAPLLQEINPGGSVEILHLYPDADPSRSDSAIQRLIKKYAPGIVISVERPGPDQTGRFRTARGKDITEHSAGPHAVMFIPGCLTIGIGDGGNALGMGALAAHLPDSRPRCVVSCRHTLVGTTSNCAAYGLIAGLTIQSGNTDLLPRSGEIGQLVAALIRAGAVDGMTSLPELSVDGFPVSFGENVLNQLRHLSDMNLRGRNIIDRFQADQRRKYHVFAGKLTTAYHFQHDRLEISGQLILDKQLDELKKISAELSPVLSVEVISGRKPRKNLETAIPVRYPMDVLDHPTGRLATQLIPEDAAAVVLWRTPEHVLVQTPDSAMGWCRADELIFHAPGTTPPPPEYRIPQPGALTPIQVDPDELHDVAVAFTGCPYRLGGRTPRGLDCSALTQAVFRRAGILLPRNSRQQRRLGVRCALDAIQPFDLVFAVGCRRKIHHVALMLQSGLLHASQTQGRVVVQERTAFERDYRIIAARRIVTFGGDR